MAMPAFAQDIAGRIEARVTTMDGEAAGAVTFEQVEHGVVVTARIENLPEGPQGFHIHGTGACAPDVQAAGGHYGPLDAEHGFDSPDRYHVGDLPNVHVAADGTATADFFAPQLALAQEEDDEQPRRRVARRHIVRSCRRHAHGLCRRARRAHGRGPPSQHC